MNKIKVVDQDIIFLSYDEPNAEKNYADLCSKVPWAKRVHGVEGSDAAHKACADLSETEYFVTVDADNIVDQEFLNQEIDLEDLGVGADYVFSWCGKVHVNGLMYGNGGLKMWTRKFVHSMKTHEHSEEGDDRGKVEFCFDNKYYQFNENFSVSYTNETPWQAWRAGFREGVKMSLDQGAKVNDLRTVWWQNYDRLLIWSQIGADVKNGIWSILGARQGCYMTNCTDWDYANVRDFKWLNNFWESDVKNLNPEESAEYYGLEILKGTGVDISTKPLDAEQSKFFKSVYQNSARILRRAK